VSVVNVARLERAALCDLFDEVGPDRPTLCAGWNTRDLAAHLVIRERRPDAAAGIIVKPLADFTERVRASTARRPFAELVDELRHPPFWTFSGFGPSDRAFNTLEFFIHHEDVRRAQPDWAPRALPRETQDDAWRATLFFGRLVALTTRRALVLRRSDATHAERRVGSGDRSITVAGEPLELLLWLSGRRDVARVELT
jgi:uncharacterized protein (TIGR03085 family)